MALERPVESITQEQQRRPPVIDLVRFPVELEMELEMERLLVSGVVIEREKVLVASGVESLVIEEWRCW